MKQLDEWPCFLLLLKCGHRFLQSSCRRSRAMTLWTEWICSVGISAQASILDTRARHPWRGFSATAVTNPDREQDRAIPSNGLSSSQQWHAETIPQLQAVVEADDFSIEDLTRLQPALASIAALDRLPHDWFDGDTEQFRAKGNRFRNGSTHATGLRVPACDLQTVTTSICPQNKLNRYSCPLSQAILETVSKDTAVVLEMAVRRTAER